MFQAAFFVFGFIFGICKYLCVHRLELLPPKAYLSSGARNGSGILLLSLFITH